MDSVVEPPLMVVVGVITYNPCLPQLKSLLISLQGQGCEIVVYDNNSQNTSDVIDLCSQFTNVSLKASEQNLGISKAANEISRIAKRKDAQFILLFDQDSVPNRSYIESLLIEYKALSDQGRKIGAIAGVQVCNFTGKKSPFVRFGKWFPQKVYFPQAVNSGVVDFLITSGCLFPLDSLREIGLFDESLFIDNVDVEWCCRAKSKGYDLIGCQVAEFSHSIGDRVINIGGRVILRIHSPLRTFYSVRNLFALAKRSYISRTWKMNSIARAALKATVMAVFNKNRSEYLKQFVRGVRSSRSIPKYPIF